ncbi:histone H1-like [Triplophysa dalaica]|uniref:histone H1-like n=1 Tax=Triplophysa dalaica TaxID=1582913 RepID=UPI0024DF430E|nr:histone H1-like [Triplophysa dalaica]
MAETAPAAVVQPAKAPKRKSAAKSTKTGPSVGELVVKAVSASKERSGVSLAALKKSLAAGGYDVEKNNSRVKIAIKSLVTKGTLVQTKGTGASGSFKLNTKQAETKKPATKAAPKAKKPAAKKPASAAAKKPKTAALKKTAAKKSPKKVKKPAATAAKKVTKSPMKAKKPAAPKKAAKSPKKAAKSPMKAKAAKPKTTNPKAAKPKKAAPKKN